MKKVNSLRSRVGFILFSIALIGYAVVMGGNLYQVIAEVPNWSANIPESLIAYRNSFNVTHPGFFFQTIVPVTIVGLIIAAVLLWNRPKAANKWVLMPLGGVVIAEAFTGFYFFPRNFALFLDPIEGMSADVLATLANEWQTANYLRMALMVATIVVFLKSYRIIAHDLGASNATTKDE